MALAVSTWACVCMVIKSQSRSLWWLMTSPMYQHAPPQIASDNRTQAETGDALAKSRKRAGTSESLHMALFLGGDDLHDGRYNRLRLSLGIGDMPLLNDEARAVLAYLGAARRHVYGMPAAGQGHSNAPKDSAGYTHPGPVEGLFPPGGSPGSLDAEIVFDVLNGVLADDGEGLVCDVIPRLPDIGRFIFPARFFRGVGYGGLVHVVHFLGYRLGMIALIVSSHLIKLLLVRGSEVLEKRHVGGVCEDKSRVIDGGEYPSASLVIDGLDGQRHGLNHFIGSVFRKA